MKEFGSDFHRCDHDFRGASNFFDVLGCMRWYACGRHAIDAIVKQEGWNRIWMPAYFCYEVIGHIREMGIEVMLYDDSPLNENDDVVVRQLPFKKGDVLLRTQYFGLRRWRSNEGISVPVIEDHTHDLISDWALRSDADWCVASLRKILPVAAGGILWSPKYKQLPDAVAASDECELMARVRYEAMEMKHEYLMKVSSCRFQEVSSEVKEQKDAFREKYIDSEERIDELTLSGIDKKSEEITRAMNIKLWTDLKHDNWLIAVGMLDKKIRVFGIEKDNAWHPFSLTLLMDSAEEREKMRGYMIQHQIYPAILWRMPENCDFARAKDFSERMLSVHCDARYSRDAITELCDLINGYYDTDI